MMVAMSATDAARRAVPVPRPDGARIAAEVAGVQSDPVVLLVAGADSSMDWWRPEFCDRIVRAGFRVVRYDQRGTGEATLGPPGARRDGLLVAIDDAIAVLDAVAADDAHWVGFSAGGWIAQLAALEHPDRVHALTLISTSPTLFEADADLPAAKPGMQEFWAHPLPEPDWSDAEDVIRHLVDIDRHYAGDHFDEANDRAMWTDTVRRSPGMHRDEPGADHVEQAPRWRERLGEIRVPTTVLHGTADPVFPLGNGRALAADIPGARFVALPGGGHDLPPTVWDAVVEAVIRGGAASPDSEP
ncbi:alpha/beta hydrolase [Rathayibacter sp. YIM 133350]|uniref:alpha/beta fold hydrolase n=1 Tax=Rathayibacter sp. YIM 133350 TaxID=3131992 RepID=UPI00307D53E5